MKEKLIKLLEIQDSSKSPFQFLFKGKRNIYFPFGMFLSLLINISTICLSTILLLELIYHIKPNNKKYDIKYKRINIYNSIQR